MFFINKILVLKILLLISISASMHAAQINMRDADIRIFSADIAKLTNKLHSFSKVVSFKPYFNEGKLEGYEISSGQEEELFNQSGLKEGDVLIAVNGLNFNDPSLAKEMSLSNARLDLLRDKKVFSLTVGLN